MEELEIVGESDSGQACGEIFTPLELRQRRPVWLAMSEVLLHEKIGDYDKNYIAIRLSESPYTVSQLGTIFDEEVRPAVASGQYIMDNRWDVVEANWLEDTVLKYLHQKEIETRNRSLPTAMLQKIRGLGAGGKKRNGLPVGQGAVGDNEAEAVWQGIEELVSSLRSEAETGQQGMVMQSPYPFGGE